MKNKERAFEVHEVRGVVGLSRAEISFWTAGEFVPIPPSVHKATGTGSRNLYGWDDVLLFALAKHMRSDGLPTPAVNAAIGAVKQKPSAEIVLLARRGNEWEADATSKQKFLDSCISTKGRLSLPLTWERAQPEVLSMYILEWGQLKVEVGGRLADYDKKQSRRKKP